MSYTASSKPYSVELAIFVLRLDRCTKFYTHTSKSYCFLHFNLGFLDRPTARKYKPAGKSVGNNEHKMEAIRDIVLVNPRRQNEVC